MERFIGSDIEVSGAQSMKELLSTITGPCVEVLGCWHLFVKLCWFWHRNTDFETVLRITELFTWILWFRGVSDLDRSRMLLLLRSLSWVIGDLSSSFLAITDPFLFMSEFSNITSFLLRLMGLDEAFLLGGNPPKSLFFNTTELLFECLSMLSASLMMSCDMVTILTPPRWWRADNLDIVRDGERWS